MHSAAVQHSCATGIDPVGGSYEQAIRGRERGGRILHLLCHLEHKKASSDIASTGPYGSIAAGLR